MSDLIFEVSDSLCESILKSRAVVDLLRAAKIRNLSDENPAGHRLVAGQRVKKDTGTGKPAYAQVRQLKKQKTLSAIPEPGGFFTRLIRIGKPPALPGDSKSLTFTGVLKVFKFTRCRMMLHETGRFPGYRTSRIM
jgi:hypothetical protein